MTATLLANGMKRTHAEAEQIASKMQAGRYVLRWVDNAGLHQTRPVQVRVDGRAEYCFLSADGEQLSDWLRCDFALCNGGDFLQVPFGTEARVCDDIAKRQSLGIAKYRTTVEHNPLQLREWLEHAYQECLDQAVYLRRAMEQFDKELP